MEEPRTAVDLHCHSTASDGTFSPRELVREAARIGLKAIALTDHDTVSGYAEALDEGNALGVEVVPGVELSCAYPFQGKIVEVHILGYFIDWEDREFQKKLQDASQARTNKNRAIIEAMQKDGYPVSYDEFVSGGSGTVMTRGNIAAYMVQKGIVKTIQSAFSGFIGEHDRYYREWERMSCEEAVRLILRYRGVAVLAHPFQYKLGSKGLDALVRQLARTGLGGIERDYTGYTNEMKSELDALAIRYGLLLTGGSDFHGDNKPGLMLGTGYGGLFVPAARLAALKRKRHDIPDDARIFFCDFDGTLAAPDRSVTEKTREALAAFSERGNVFVLSSGRVMENLKDLQQKLALPAKRLYLCAWNGAEIWDCREERTVFRMDLSRPVIESAFALAAERGIYLQTFDAGTIVTKQYTGETRFYTEHADMPVRLEEDPAASLSVLPCKCLAIDLEDQEKLLNFAKDLEALHPEIHCFLSNPWYLEIVPRNASKADSLIALCRLLGVDRARTAAAGDAQNDIPMLDAAALAIAMCNGVETAPELLEHADVVTAKDNAHDGLAPILSVL